MPGCERVWETALNEIYIFCAGVKSFSFKNWVKNYYHKWACEMIARPWNGKSEKRVSPGRSFSLSLSLARPETRNEIFIYIYLPSYDCRCKSDAIRVRNTVRFEKAVNQIDVEPKLWGRVCGDRVWEWEWENGKGNEQRQHKRWWRRRKKKRHTDTRHGEGKSMKC